MESKVEIKGVGQLCKVCCETFLVVHNSSWMLRCHNDWLTAQKNAQRLRSGADYFSE
jgi:hypothetical protein